MRDLGWYLTSTPGFKRTGNSHASSPPRSSLNKQTSILIELTAPEISRTHRRGESIFGPQSDQSLVSHPHVFPMHLHDDNPSGLQPHPQAPTPHLQPHVVRTLLPYPINAPRSEDENLICHPQTTLQAIILYRTSGTLVPGSILEMFSKRHVS